MDRDTIKKNIEESMRRIEQDRQDHLKSISDLRMAELMKKFGGQSK